MPGLIFIRGYFRFPYPRAFTTTDEIVAAMVFAIPLQSLSIWLIQGLTSYRIDFIQLGTLMDGAKSDIADECARPFRDVTCAHA